MSLRTEIEGLAAPDLISALSIRIYEPPLLNARKYLGHVSQALRVPILVIDFDTEVTMNGILGFLENSTGMYLPETIHAFEAIGAHRTCETLRKIQGILDQHGVTTAMLRADLAGTDSFAITTFNETHGDLGTLPSEIDEVIDGLYLHNDTATAEPVWSLLEQFVEKYRRELLADIDRIAGEGGFTASDA